MVARDRPLLPCCLPVAVTKASCDRRLDLGGSGTRGTGPGQIVVSTRTVLDADLLLLGPGVEYQVGQDLLPVKVAVLDRGVET